MNLKLKNTLPLFIIIFINIVVFYSGYSGGELVMGGRSQGFAQSPLNFITSMFMHANAEHLYRNMLSLLMFGYTLSMLLGGVKFLFLYILGGIGASIVSIFYYQRAFPDTIILSVGASGAIYAIIGAYIALIIKNRSRYMRANNIRFIALVVAGLILTKSNNINNAAHIGGLISGIIIMTIIINISRRIKNGL